MLTESRFHFRPWLTVFSAVALAILLGLGNWQLERRSWKLALIESVEAGVSATPIHFDAAVRAAQAGDQMEYRSVKLTGKLSPGFVANVFGAYDGDAGAFVFLPMTTPTGAVVYVNLGFQKQGVEDGDQFGGAANGLETTEVIGLLRYAERPRPPAAWFRPTGKTGDGLWFVRDPERFAQDAGIDASPYYIDQFAVPGREWPKGGTTRLDFNNRHLEYALTWFGLAGALVGVWIAFSLRKP